MTRPIDLCLDYAEATGWGKSFVIQGAEGMSNEYYVQYVFDKNGWSWTAGGTVGGPTTREEILKKEFGRNKGWRVQPTLFKTTYS